MKFRIMIVDDEEDVRLLLKSALQPEYEVVEAINGLDALEKLERSEPDFIILDVMMPIMEGFDTCNAIRRHPKFNDVPVMFLTALADKDSIKKGYGKGANLYLTKPFETERLLKNIKVHFGGSSQDARPKKFGIDELEQMETSDAEPAAPGASEFVPPPPSAQSGVNKAPAAAEAEPEPQAVLPRVMVVDDDPDIISIFEGALEGTAEVVWANDGMQAVERLVRWQPDMMIIDIMLPKMSGYQICQTLRANKAFMRMPIAVCSAKCSEKDQAMAKRVGATEFLAKPFTAEQAVGLVKGITRMPGFRIRPKTMPLEDIHKVLKAANEKSDVFKDTEGEQLRSRIQQLANKAEQSPADSERLSKDSGGSTSKSRVKRFFGIGKK